jgi:hypothetical protein
VNTRFTRFIKPIWAPGGAKEIYNHKKEDDPKDRTLIDKYKMVFTCK